MKPRSPRVGDIVIYTIKTRRMTDVPAIVTAVVSRDHGETSVSLTFFPNPGEDDWNLHDGPPLHRYSEAMRDTGVSYGRQRGQWRWPGEERSDTGE